MPVPWPSTRSRASKAEAAFKLPIWLRQEGACPVVITFVDTDEHVTRVLPKLREMAAHRLIVRENVVIEQGSLD